MELQLSQLVCETHYYPTGDKLGIQQTKIIMATKGRKPIPKTQKEISNEFINPYDPPKDSPGFSSTGKS